MAKLQLSDLIKHNYKNSLIQKIEEGIPIILFPDNTKPMKTAILTLDKKYLNLFKEAKTEEDYEAFLKDPKTKRFYKIFKNNSNNKMISISEISKESVKTGNRKGDAKTTRLQELCSLKIIEIILEKNRKYNLQELCDIYPDLSTDKTWLISYEAQYIIFKKIISKLKIPKMKYYNRDGGFMDFISKEVKRLGFSKKDIWNPADIWLIKDDNVQKEIKEGNFKTVEQLNAKMVELYHEKRLIGISLKKTNKIANYEINNINTTTNRSSYPFINGNLLLEIKDNKFINDELNYNLEYSNDKDINVQVRMYPKKARSNVQVSYKVKNEKAEIGKVPSSMRNATLKTLSYDFPQGKKMPLNIDDFLEQEREFRKMLTIIYNKKLFNIGVNSINKAIENIKYAYINGSNYAEIELNTKLQGLYLAYFFSSITPKKLEGLVTDWGYLAQKKGEKFGPFIKIH